MPPSRKESSPRPEDVGAMGQHFLALLAKTAGLVANASSDDKAGWDFELEPASPTAISYHSHSRPLYRIQVKASVGTSYRVSMTFSSLVSLVQFSGPSFLFFVRFDSHGTTDPLDARLLHVDETVARRILTRMREREVQNPGSKFKANRATLSIDFKSGQPIDLKNGSLLRDALSSATAPNYLEYVREKTRWLRTLEHEAVARRYSIRFKDEVSIQAMANALLGYESEAILDAVQYTAPMGIPDIAPEHRGDFHPIGLKPTEESILRATVRLKVREFGATYAFPARLYSNIGMVPPRFEATRTQASMFDVILKREPLNVRLVTVDVDDPQLVVPIRDLRNFVAFMDEASHEDVKETHLEIDLSNGTPPLRLSPSTHVAVFEGHHALRLGYDALYSRLESIGLGDALIRPARYFQEPAVLNFLQNLGSSYAPSITIEFEGPEGSRSDANAVIFTMPVELEGTLVHFFGVFVGSVEIREASRFAGTFTHSMYGGEVIVRNTNDLDEAKKAFSDELQKKLESRGLRVL